MVTRISENNVEEFDVALFENRFYGRSQPLLVHGLYFEKENYSRWTKDFLLESIKGLDRGVGVSIYEKRESRYEQFFTTGTSETLPIEEAITLALSDPTNSGRYHNLLEAAVPELINTIEIPVFLADKTNSAEGNLWIGNGNITGLHFDAYNNFYFQVKGSKTFYIFDPAHYFYLYPFSSNGSHIIDVLNIDKEKFPLTRHIQPIVVRLNPGDFLYLPPFWWHQVESNDAYISINFWGYPRLDQCLCYPGFYEVLKYFELGLLMEMYEQTHKLNVEHYDVREVIQLLLFRGYNWMAFLFAIALLQSLYERHLNENDISFSEAIFNRTEELFKRMDKQEMNLDNIRHENLGESRFEETINLLLTKDLISKEHFESCFSFLPFIRSAKLIDNKGISEDLVNHVLDHFEYATNYFNTIVKAETAPC